MSTTKASEIPERLKKAIDRIYANLKNGDFIRALSNRRWLQENLEETSDDYATSSLLNIIKELSHPIYQAVSNEVKTVRELVLSHRFKEASARLQPLTGIVSELSRDPALSSLIPEISSLERILPLERSSYLEKKRQEIRQISDIPDVSQSLSQLLELFDELETSGLQSFVARDLQHAVDIEERRVRESYLSETRIIFQDTTIHQDRTTKLTPIYLAQHVTPYLQAIAEIQHIMDSANAKPLTEVTVKAITQNSPINVNLDGAADAVKLVQETVIPWRRKHAETMARLVEQEKQAEIESKKAEILERRAHAQKDRVEAAKQGEEAEKLKLENEMLRLELHRAKIQLALDILNQVAPQLSEAQRVEYLLRLLPPLDTLIVSNLEIAMDKPKSVG